MTTTPITDQAVTSREALNRQVWVVYNRAAVHGDMPGEYYEEAFRGQKIQVPLNGEKTIKMPYMAAERFLGQMPLSAPEQMPNGHWVHPPKALKIVEMTDEERGVRLTVKEDDSLKCVLCDFIATDTRGLKRHTTVKHPEHGNVSEE